LPREVSVRRLLPLSLLAAIALAMPAGAVVVSGRLVSPSARVPALTVYAWSRSAQRLYSSETVAGAAGYALDLPPGRYWVFAVPSGPGAPPVYGAHTRFSLCARDPGAVRSGRCADHSLVEVEVARRPVADVDLSDWSLENAVQDQLDRVRGRPPGEAWTPALLGAPRFSEYPTAQVAPSGAATLAEPADARASRDQSALAAALSAGRANFAGHYSLVRVACGERCEDVVILDLTSALASYPEVLNPLPGHAPCGVTDPLAYRVDSRLLTVTGSDGSAVTTRYLVLDGAALRLVATLSRPLSEACPP
jgi:hypothetical protein